MDEGVTIDPRQRARRQRQPMPAGAPGLRGAGLGGVCLLPGRPKGPRKGLRQTTRPLYAPLLDVMNATRRWRRVRLGVGVAVFVAAAGVQAGHAGAARPSARVVTSDSRLLFGPQGAGTESGVRRFEVFNPGPAPVSIRVHIRGRAFTLAGAASTCGVVGVLRVGEQCAVAVRFIPRAPGARVGMVEVGDPTGSLLTRVRLDGTAYPTQAPQLPGGALTIDPAVVRFGRQVVGTRSGP